MGFYKNKNGVWKYDVRKQVSVDHETTINVIRSFEN
jgi:hypothetical protein